MSIISSKNLWTFLLIANNRSKLACPGYLNACVRNMSSNNNAGLDGTISRKIKEKLSQALNPTHLEVLNESYMHNVPKGSETHFKVIVVSDTFCGLTPIKRHRSINEILKEELSASVHALSITAKTPEQWSANNDVAKSPPCRGGAGL